MTLSLKKHLKSGVLGVVTLRTLPRRIFALFLARVQNLLHFLTHCHVVLAVPVERLPVYARFGERTKVPQGFSLLKHRNFVSIARGKCSVQFFCMTAQRLISG